MNLLRAYGTCAACECALLCDVRVCPCRARALPCNDSAGSLRWLRCSAWTCNNFHNYALHFQLLERAVTWHGYWAMFLSLFTYQILFQGRRFCFWLKLSFENSYCDITSLIIIKPTPGIYRPVRCCAWLRWLCTTVKTCTRTHALATANSVYYPCRYTAMYKNTVG